MSAGKPGGAPPVGLTTDLASTFGDLLDGDIGQAILLVIHARDPAIIGTRIPIGAVPLFVGRAPGDGGFVIDDGAASRRHASFFMRGGVCMCRDLGARNRTLVNELPVDRDLPLATGDRIRIGRTVLVFLSQSRQSRAHSVLDALPHPVAVLKAAVMSHASPMLRVRAALDGIEMGLRFLVAVELAALRAVATGDARGQLLAIVREHARNPAPLTMGRWEDLAWRLAKLCPADSQDPPFAVAHALVRKRGQPSELAQRIKKVVAYRNEFAHGVTRAEAAYEEDEPLLRDTLDELVVAFCPLSHLLLASVDRVELGEEDDTFRYWLRAHRGPLARFPIREQISAFRLLKDWCHLVDEGEGSAAPLCLAPLLACRPVEDSGQLELVIADRLCAGPRNATVTMRSLASPATVEMTVPWRREEQLFFAELDGTR